MSKFSFFCGVETVKSNTKIEEKQDAAEDVAGCPKISKVDDGNLLEDVDDDVLYVNNSIAIEEPKMQAVDAEKPTDKSTQTPQDQPRITPTPLHTQIQLPLQNVQSLCFSEVLMISHPASSNSASLIPKPEEIDEIGNLCVTVEQLEDGNFMVYNALQTMTGAAQESLDILSVVDKNLKLVHEKRIRRTCVGGRFTVNFNENIFDIIFNQFLLSFLGEHAAHRH